MKRGVKESCDSPAEIVALKKAAKCFLTLISTD